MSPSPPRIWACEKNGLVCVNSSARSILSSDSITGICATATSITVGIVVGSHIIAGVKLHIDSLSVPLPGVVLRAPVVIDMVCITVVVPSRSSNHILSGIIARHLHEVESGVAMAANVAHVHRVGDVVAQKRSLPVDVGGAEVICCLLSKVDTATPNQSEPIINHLHSAWVLCHHIDVSNACNVDAAHVLERSWNGHVLAPEMPGLPALV